MVINLFYEIQVMGLDNKKKPQIDLSIAFEIWLGHSFKNNTWIIIHKKCIVSL